MNIGDQRKAYWGWDLGKYDEGIYKTKITYLGPNIIITETGGWYRNGRQEIRKSFFGLSYTSEMMNFYLERKCNIWEGY